jgi:hypothetical protein
MKQVKFHCLSNLATLSYLLCVCISVFISGRRELAFVNIWYRIATLCQEENKSI